MSLGSFAKSELQRAGLFDKDSDYGGMLGESVMKMMEVFAGEGHSGYSAGMAISIFKKVASFEPLTPLTGEDDEWMEIGEQNGGPLYQNVRSPRVFKDREGAYDIDAKVFREPSGACFTSSDSRAPVTFPYTPTTEYIDVPDRL
ncbi:MAG: hypothetical protein WC100_18900 [Sterolibacterium sp.]